jgi:hypothetical protein
MGIWQRSTNVAWTKKNQSWRAVTLFLLAFVVPLVATALSAAQSPTSGASADPQLAKSVGTIKSIQPDSITVAAESGGDVTVKLTASTKILRVPPGEKDLKNSVALDAQDLQPGDRVLVRGQAAADPQSITALAVIVMRQSDVAAKKQQQQEDWQKRGAGGLVTKVDAASNTITISSISIAANKSIAIRITQNTILRRYAPGSVKFDDAKLEPAAQFIGQTKAGDQLRARGSHSADGSELAAEEIVAGSFRNIAGTIRSIDAASSTITVQDSISKSALVVKVSADSQMKKLPPEMAQRIAMRLKAAAGSDANQSGSAVAPSSAQTQSRNQDAAIGQGTPPREKSSADGQRRVAGSSGGNGPPDLQRMLSRLPNSTLADLQKGDAVMIVATEGSASEAATAITLLAGVESILTAAPSRSTYSLLSPWSLSSPGGEGEGAQ